MVKLVTYVAGPVKSTVDYIMVRQEDKAKIRNVKVITSEECVPKHKLLVMDMRFKATKRQRRKFEPRVRVWKVKEEKTCEEFRCMVGDKVEEVKWKGLGVNDHWQQMKGIVVVVTFITLKFSCICLAIKMASVVPLPFINSNCMSSISICCRILCSKVFSTTFIAYSNSFYPCVRSTLHRVTFAFVDW